MIMGSCYHRAQAQLQVSPVNSISTQSFLIVGLPGLFEKEDKMIPKNDNLK